jgi:alpha-1,3-glucosyltransferase
VHFQYNGFLLGLLVFSIALVKRHHYIAAAVVYSALLNFKHIFVYIAPAFLVHLLAVACFEPKSSATSFSRFKPCAFLSLSAAVLSVFFLSLGPFIFWGQFTQVLSRLFPFGERGLTTRNNLTPTSPNTRTCPRILGAKCVVIVIMYN